MTRPEYTAEVFPDRREQKWRAVIRDNCGSTTIVSHRSLSVLREFLDRQGVGLRVHRPQREELTV